MSASYPSIGTPSLVSMRAYTRSESEWDMQTAILPSVPVGSPFPASSVHVSPPSIVRWSPLPGPPLSRFHVLRSMSHIVAKIFRGFAGSMTMS